jgi:hypothetical protein
MFSRMEDDLGGDAGEVGDLAWPSLLRRFAPRNDDAEA